MQRTLSAGSPSGSSSRKSIDVTVPLAPTQAVILVGGLGTRLGALTADTPKPLLPIAGRPFLDVLISELKRQGFRSILLLAGFRGRAVEEYVRSRPGGDGVEIDVLVEPEPLGTGGALRCAEPRLDEQFLILNGDSWFDTNWLCLVPAAAAAPGAALAMLLRWEDDATRFGVVEVQGAAVRGFQERGSDRGGWINAGVYLGRRELVRWIPPRSSLERDVLPELARAGRITAVARDGFFVDIGIPHTYADAQTAIPTRLNRPAVFFDRDGVLNVDTGYVHCPRDLHWIEGAVDAVRLVNDAGWHAFVITNQAGVARGHYGEEAVQTFHAFMQTQLRQRGAFIDDFRYCPFHVEGIVPAYASESNWRKPEPGMIVDLMERWPVRPGGSFVVGDKQSDIEAAARAGIPGHLFREGSLLDFVRERLDRTAPPTP